MKGHVKNNVTRKEFRNAMLIDRHIPKYNGCEIKFRPELTGRFFALEQTFYIMECHDKKKNESWFWVHHHGFIRLPSLEDDQDSGILFMFEGKVDIDKISNSKKFKEYLVNQWHRYDEEMEREYKEKEDKK